MLFCGFRAVLILPGYYPTGIARGIRPFVDLLLTRRSDSKKPRWMAGRKTLICIVKSGCGGRILTCGLQVMSRIEQTMNNHSEPRVIAQFPTLADPEGEAPLRTICRDCAAFIDLVLP